LTGYGCFEILITWFISTFILFPSSILISLSVMPYSTISSLASSTRSSAYFTVWITCLPTVKSPNPSRVSLVMYHCTCWIESVTNSLLVLLLFQSSHFLFQFVHHSLTIWSMYSLLISLLLCQSVSFPLESALIWYSLHSPVGSARLCSKHTIHHLCPSFVLILFIAS
jgi:hypothetical protein